MTCARKTKTPFSACAENGTKTCLISKRMKYRLVQNSQGRWEVSEFNSAGFIEAMESRGFTVTGTCQNSRVREELRGQPEFAGLCGPMYDGTDTEGTPVIRYECSAAYKILSA